MNLLDSNYDESEGGSPVTLLQNNKVNTFAGGVMDSFVFHTR